MKFYLTFFLLVNLVGLQAQTKDSTNVEIEDVVVFGLKEKKCSEIYDREKNLYQKQVKELKTIKFKSLFDELFKLEEFKRINFNVDKLLILNLDYTTIISSCGNMPYSDCSHYEKNISQDVFNSVWSKKNYRKFQIFFKNKTIFPLIQSPWYFLEEAMKEENYFIKKYNFKPFFKGVYTDSKSKTRDFYYSSNEKPSEILEIHFDKKKVLSENFIKLDLKIFPAVREDLSNVYVVTLNLKEKENNLRTRILLYQYVDRQWKFLEELK